MKTLWMPSLVVAAVFGLACVAGAGERGMGPPAGPLQQILEHAKELNLTADQRTKVEALSKEMGGARDGAMREKLKDNPELAREMKEARQSGDQAKIKEAREKMREKMGANAPGAPAEGKRGEVMQKLTQILTPEQMKQVKEMREKNAQEGGGPRRGKDGAGGGDANKGNKPDASKGVPNPFDN